MKQPDPKLHFQISMVKSGFRILAGGTLIMGSIMFCGIFLVIAEIVGIIEEMV